MEVKECGMGFLPDMDITYMALFIVIIIVVSSVLIAVLVLKLRNKNFLTRSASPYSVETSPGLRYSK